MNAAVQPISAATRRSILLLSFATFSSMVAQRICDAMLPELSRVFSVGLAQAAQVVSVFAITYGLSQMAWGPLGDRLGKFPVVAFATLACSVGSVLSALAATLDVLLLARVLVALGAAAIIPLALAWVGDTVTYEQRQEMLARVGLGSTLGIVGGQLAGGLLTDTLGWRWAFAFLTVLFAAVGSLLLADWRRQRAAHAPSPAGTGAAPSDFVKKALAVVTGRWSRIVLLVTVIEGAAGFGVLAIWASHLHRSLALSLTAAGTIVAMFGLGGMVYMALARRLIPLLGERGLAALGSCVMGLAAIVLAITPHWVPAIAASLAGGFGFFMLHNTLQANATQMAPASRGVGMSVFASTLFLGQSIGVLLAAGLAERIGSATVIALAGVVVAAAGVGFGHTLGRRHKLSHPT